MSDLLEAGQAALVAITVDRATNDVRAALTGATITVVTDGVTADVARSPWPSTRRTPTPAQTALT